MDEELDVLLDVTERFDNVLLLDSVSEYESDGSGSGSGVDFDFFEPVGRLDLYVLGLSVNVIKNDMVSGKDDTDDVSSKLVFSFLSLVYDSIWFLLIFWFSYKPYDKSEQLCHYVCLYLFLVTHMRNAFKISVVAWCC